MASRWERIRCGLVTVLVLLGTLLAGPAHELLHGHADLSHPHEARACCARGLAEVAPGGAPAGRPHLHAAEGVRGGELPCALCSFPRLVPAPAAACGLPTATSARSLDRVEVDRLPAGRAREARGRAPPQLV